MLVTPLSRELKRLRAERGLTVRDLAHRLGKSTAYVGKIESQGEIPTPEVTTEIAAVLSVDPRMLLGLARESLLSQYAREISRKQAQVIAGLSPGTESGSLTTARKDGGNMAVSVSLINMKGGVGKTTIAVQLAHAADRADLRVLAVDLDPQSNLSQVLMTPKGYVDYLRAKKPTIVQIFDEYVPAGSEVGAPHRFEADDLIVKKAGYWKESTLDLIPSRLELANAVKNSYRKERRLAKFLSQVQDRYDLIIIDCAPTESMLTDAAYHASRHVIVPIKPEFLATIGLPLLARSLEGFQQDNEDHEIGIAGLVFNHSSTYSSGPEGQQSIKEVADFAKRQGWYVCENQVKYSASYAKAAREGTPIGQTSYVRTEVTQGFAKLKDEIFGITGVSKGEA